MSPWAPSLLCTLLITTSSVATAISGDDLPAKKQTDYRLYLSSVEANNMIINNSTSTLFLDVRTRAEVNLLGMPGNVDANIPYFTSDSLDNLDSNKSVFRLSTNRHFLSAVEERLQDKGLTKNDVVVLICRSGKRSANAANLMKKAGYKKVYSVVDGFEGDKSEDPATKGKRIVNGWKNSHMPWTYKLDKNKMYTEL